MTTLSRAFSPAVSTPQAQVTTLAERWAMLREQQSGLRIRNAAALLSVSEVELLATLCGQQHSQAEEQVTRLVCAPYDLLAELHSVGPLMALVRNEHAVHETIGSFGKLSGNGPVRLFLGAQDQRLFAFRWTKAFFSKTDARESIQFFNAQGSASFKLFTRPDTDMDAWAKLVSRYVAEDQSQTETVAPASPETQKVILSHDEAARLRERWGALRDIHQFNQLLRDFEVGRLTAVQYAGNEWVREVSSDAIELALTQAKEQQLSIMTFVSNGDIVQIHTGVPDRLLRTGPWFNVLDPSFNLHLNTAGIAQAWVITRPTGDGLVTTLEAFDAHGNSILQLFGERHEGEPELAEWRALTEQLPTPDKETVHASA
ncbi:hemin-degrading factor [Salinispirillum sp. LH 10-3-1]|uniref:Hemin-degrading factor n=1 Tax=Salinispirillum sp. LH 10-3-1 TaxID=2952525 RepID=A0AB38YIR1_9GAMM